MFLTSILELPADQSNTSTTPPGSPPQQSLGMQPTATAAGAPNPLSIMEVLANLARQNTAAPAPKSSSHPQDSSYNVSNAQTNPASQAAAFNQTQTIPFPPAPVNVPAAVASFASPNQGLSSGAQTFASNQTNPFAAAPPLVQSSALDPAVQQQLMLIKALSDQGIPPDQIASLIAAMGNQGPPTMGPGGAPPPQFNAQNQDQNIQGGQNGWGARPDESRDRNGYHESLRSPNRYRRRSRSPSPPRTWNARDSPTSRRRDEAKHDYETDSSGRTRGDERGHGRGRVRGNDYRQRSPPRRGRSPTPPPRSDVSGPKWIGHDPQLAKGNIKGWFFILPFAPNPFFSNSRTVLSRTLFVGGVT